MMKYLLTTELKQRQTISPQVYQSLKILQMNSLQLDDYIKDMTLENPVLEVDEGMAYSSGGVQSLDSMWEPSVWAWEEGGGSWSDDNDLSRDVKAPDTGESLREYLISQFFCELAKEEVQLLCSILEYVDGSGYLIADDAEISAATGFPQEYINYGVAYLQMLDPLGVCSRTLKECLSIQLERLGYKEPALKYMVQNCLEDIAAGHYNKIAREISRTPKEVREFCAIIKELNPKPGACFGGVTAAPAIPDMFIIVEDGVVYASIDKRSSGRIHISNYYTRLAKEDEYGEAAGYLEEKLAQAKWLVNAIEGRQSTLQSIGNALTVYQRAFFLNSNGGLQPLTLREVAEKLELHESTISRAISGKYLQCSRGTFPLKYFFATAVGGAEDGQAASRETVKDKLQAMIAAEDKANPLSDNRITEVFAGQGINLSRRVIAKYRGELNIPSAHMRREH